MKKVMVIDIPDVAFTANDLENLIWMHHVARPDVVKVQDMTGSVARITEMREAQKCYSEQFPTGYEVYAPKEAEQAVDEIIKNLGELDEDD